VQILLEYLANRKICTKFVPHSHNLWITIQTCETHQPVSLLDGSLSVCVHVPQRARWSENIRCDMRDRVKFVA
jgi:hypothetical protein